MRLNDIQLSRVLEQARTLVQEEKFLHAVQVYVRLIREEQTFNLPYLELASLYAEMGLMRPGIDVLLRGVSVLPAESEFPFQLGNFYIRIEDYDSSLAWYKKLIDKKLPQVHFNMGIAYFYKSNFKAAEEQFRLTLRFDPTFPKINESIGELLIKRQAYTEAVEFLKRGTLQDPYSAVNHYLLGVAFSRLEQWNKAYSEFITAVDMDPNESSSWQMCGETLVHLKRFNEAEAYLRKALELYPQSIDTLVDLGHVLLMKGERDRAREYIDKALHVDPVNTRAREERWNLQKVGKHRSKK